MQEPEVTKTSPEVAFVEGDLDGNVVHMESSKLQSRGIEEVEKPISTYTMLRIIYIAFIAP